MPVFAFSGLATCHTALVALFVALVSVSGCDSSAAVEIRGVTPTLPAPGAQVAVVGHGFCGEFGTLPGGNCLPNAILSVGQGVGPAITFRPNDVLDYRADEIRFQLPAAANSGVTLLTLTVEDFGFASVPLEIGSAAVGAADE